MTLVSKENHICPSCGKKWKCTNEHEINSEYLCSRCLNKSDKEFSIECQVGQNPTLEFGEKP